MATPKGVQGVSTPKNINVSTPNRPIASPRPGVGTFGNKTLAYKSPAVKTPVSAQGHSHRVSISSHPTSTPLAAPAIHDELLNLNSPAAALIASISNTGLTPITTGQDGLGITTGITPQPGRDPVVLAKTPESERLSRLEQVAKSLKTHTAGRGITREGVERVAQIQGFTILWDEENLTIAGNKVDLEITFDALDRDIVRDVQLRLNTSGSDEPQLQKDASAVLKQHLDPSNTTIPSTDGWQHLDAFGQDLEYLSRLDYTESPVNCFELMGGLYTAFRRIWDEEKQRMRDRSAAHRICQSNIGKPSIDGQGRLGVQTQYWTDKQHYQTAINHQDPPAETPATAWTARFSCDKGAPGIVPTDDWLNGEPLQTATTTADVFKESQVERPNWADPAANKTLDEQQKVADAMILDSAQNPSTGVLDLVFTCRFHRPILVPINSVNGLNGQYPMLQIDQSKALTYQQALVNKASSTPIPDWTSDLRWSKSLSVYDVQGQTHAKKHSYSLFPSGVPWSYPVTEVRFSHPKQFAENLPTFRQYALLWSILHNTLAKDAGVEVEKSYLANSRPKAKAPESSMVKRRSNRKHAQDELDDLLSSKEPATTTLRVDMSLDLLTATSKAKLDLVVPVMGLGDSDDAKANFLNISIEICPYGLIEIPVINGVRSADQEKLKRKAVKVLGLSEDIAILVEWLLDEIQKPT